MRILWRGNPNEPIREYFLKTIIYGVAEDNAPDEETRWIIKNAFYMDGLEFRRRQGNYPKNQVNQQIAVTKRKILSIAASLYDPIGWILPVVMKLRIGIQRLRQDGYDWDDRISETGQERFTKVLHTLDRLNQVRIPRSNGYSKPEDIMELVGFSNASGDGYTAVIYSRVKVNEEYVVRLIAAKGRITPIKTRIKQEYGVCTIPKLELESVAMLTEVYQDVKRSMGIFP